MKYLEIAVFNIESAMAAEKFGADRIEFCENATEGGTTPSYGSLTTLKKNLSIPIFPIVRPRGGDFLYSSTEFEVMKYDIEIIKNLGYEGIVMGILYDNGSLDYKKNKKLIDLAYPLEVTLHRAFDRTNNPIQSLEIAVDCGFQRILTSGQVPNAFNGISLIKELIEKADDRIIIMPGSGIRSSNAKQLMNETGAKEIHSSARILINSAMKFNQSLMQEKLESVFVDETEIKLLSKIVHE